MQFLEGLCSYEAHEQIATGRELVGIALACDHCADDPQLGWRSRGESLMTFVDSTPAFRASSPRISVHQTVSSSLFDVHKASRPASRPPDTGSIGAPLFEGFLQMKAAGICRSSLASSERSFLLCEPERRARRVPFPISKHGGYR